MLPIVIEIPDSEAARQHAPALVSACREVSTLRTCERAQASQASDARVLWLEGGRIAEVGAWIEGEWRTRRLEFADADQMAERWRAAGLVVGSIFEAAAMHPAPKPPATAPAPAGAAPVSSIPPPPEPPRLGLGLGGLGGTGLVGGTQRWGLFGRLVYRPTGLPLGAAATLSVAWVEPRAGLAARWASATAGPVAIWEPLPELGLELGVELGREQLRVSLESADQDPQPSQERSYVILAGRVLARWQLAGAWAAIGGMGVSTTPGQAVRISGQQVAENPRVAVSALLGLGAEF